MGFNFIDVARILFRDCSYRVIHSCRTVPS